MGKFISSLMACFAFGLLVLNPTTSHALVLEGCDATGCCITCCDRGAHCETQDEIAEKLDEVFDDIRAFFIEDLIKNEGRGEKQYQAKKANATEAEETKMRAGISDHVSATENITKASGDITETIIESPVNENLCEVASTTENISDSVHNTKETADVSVQMGTDSALAVEGTASATGPGTAVEDRAVFTLLNYVSPSEFDGAAYEAAGEPNSDPARWGRDVAPFILDQYTLDYNPLEGSLNDTTIDVQALRNNLFNSPIPRLNRGSVRTPEGRAALMEIDKLAFFQGLATYSFDSIVALRSETDTPNPELFRNALENSGLTDEGTIANILGENDKPSLMAQYKVMSKVLPFNVSSYNAEGETIDIRQKRVMNEALSIMIKFEIYKSLKRTLAHDFAMHEMRSNNLNEIIRQNQ